MILNYLEFFKVFPFAHTTKNTLPKFKKIIVRLSSHIKHYCVFVLFDAYRPNQQLWSCRDGKFT